MRERKIGCIRERERERERESEREKERERERDQVGDKENKCSEIEDKESLFSVNFTIGAFFKEVWSYLKRTFTPKSISKLQKDKKRDRKCGRYNMARQ